MFRLLHTSTAFLPKSCTLKIPISVTVSKFLFHSNAGNLQLSTVSNTVPSTAKLNPEKGQFTAEELLRLEATKIERMSCLRSRTRWLPEEDRRLLDLAERYQRKWTYLTRFFVDRPAANLCNRYKMLINEIKLGGWSKEELEELQNFGNGRSYDEIDDWEKLKESPLFHNRPLSMVKATYKHSFDPRIHKGRWTREESDKLEKYVAMFGEDEMDKIAQFIGTRTKRQCLERWRWQMSGKKKGRFTAEEDQKIMEAVKLYGENFAAICKVTGINRTPRHVSQHYHHRLNPATDRSPWTTEEMKQVYETCLANDNNMLKTKEILGSQRSVRDMWNRFKTYKRYLTKMRMTEATSRASISKPTDE